MSTQRATNEALKAWMASRPEEEQQVVALKMFVSAHASQARFRTIPETATPRRSCASSSSSSSATARTRGTSPTTTRGTSPSTRTSRFLPIYQCAAEEHDAATGGRRFNALLATASINDAIEYYEVFKKLQAERQTADPEFVPLKIAAVFSPPVSRTSSGSPI